MVFRDKFVRSLFLELDNEDGVLLYEAHIHEDNDGNIRAGPTIKCLFIVPNHLQCASSMWDEFRRRECYAQILFSGTKDLGLSANVQ